MDTLSQTLKRIHASDHTTRNRLLSIASDAAWVEAVLALAPATAAVAANLRCGVWYTPPARATTTAYFKSTDGHTGEWAFSLTRLNAHLIAIAAHAGALVIVDATRRGKPLPDALAKTIPLWAAVWNAAAGWDVDSHPHAALHVAPSVLPSELHAMRALVRPAAAALARAADVAADVAALADKPLRPIWVSQTDRNLAALTPLVAPHTLPFIPIICVSASAPRSRMRATASTASICPFATSYTFVQGAADDEELWAPPTLTASAFHTLRPLFASVTTNAALDALIERMTAGITPSAPPLSPDPDAPPGQAPPPATVAFVAPHPDVPLTLAIASAADVGSGPIAGADLVVDLVDAADAPAESDAPTSPPAVPRRLTLVVPPSKKARMALEGAAATLIAAVTDLVAANGHAAVAFVCPDGLDRGPAAALIAMIALDTAPHAEGVDKAVIRRHHLALCKVYPLARISRYTMKQVTRTFMSRGPRSAGARRDAGGPSDSGSAPPPSA